MFVQGLAFLTTISKRIKYRTAEFVANRKISTLEDKLTNVIKMYQRAGFKVSTIYCDNEFSPLRKILLDQNISCNVASAQEHVPDIERSIRVIKERIRAVWHGLPFNAITNTMWKYLVTEVTNKLNYFPVKGGVSSYYSPRAIIHSKPLSYTQHCKIPIFSYVQAHDEPEPKNSLQERTLSCIYLRSLNNQQGGHELLHLGTWKVITRRNVTVSPMPKSVIQRIENRAECTAEPDDLGDTVQFPGVDKSSNDDQSEDSNDPSFAGVDSAEHDYDDCDGGNNNDESEEKAHKDNDDSDDYFTDDAENNNDESEEKAHEDNDDSDDYFTDANNDDDYFTDSNHDENEHSDENENSENAHHDENENSEKLTACTRTGRAIKAPTRLITQLMQKEDHEEKFYDPSKARMIAAIMQNVKDVAVQHVTTYSLKAGMKKFGDRGRNAAIDEMKQLHDRSCFVPIHEEELETLESERALESLIFITEKRDGRVKARHCANGSVQRRYMTNEDVSSPTVTTEAVLITSVIDAEEHRDVITCDIPNAFIQTDMDMGKERVIMKIRGELVDILCEMNEGYAEYVKNENGKKVLYVHVKKAIYGLLESALLFYKKLSSWLMEEGYEINPYDICVGNKMINGSQHTVMWHVDDLKASHVDPKVNDNFIKSLNREFGKLAKIKTTRGKIHDYLGMTLDFSIKGKVTINMEDYVKSMVSSFPNEELAGRKVTSPWNEDLFKVDDECTKLNQEQAKLFHTITAQGIFLCKRGRPDIAPAIAFLSTRVQHPTTEDWSKLKRMVKYLMQTSNDKLTLQSDHSRVMQWHVDAAFAVHPDLKSHTGGMLSMGKGAITAISRKQNLNTRSSTEAELVAADDVVGPMLWTKHFLDAQGYGVKKNVLHQDNQSAIKLEANGRKSAGKRSRHLNIRLFYITDQIEKKEIDVTFCPTDNMIADYFTKPLHGEKFKRFRQVIMNLPTAAQLMMWHCMQL
jgi:hypothetical protein